jgi:hypothetical protein
MRIRLILVLTIFGGLNMHVDLDLGSFLLFVLERSVYYYYLCGINCYSFSVFLCCTSEVTQSIR